MAGWHHWLDGRESGWTPGVCDGQGGLACCDSWGRKELDTNERLIWSDLICKYSCLDRDGFLALLTAPSSLTSLPPCLQFLSCSLKVVCQLLSSNSTTKCFECFVSVVIFMFPSTFLTLLFFFFNHTLFHRWNTLFSEDANIVSFSVTQLCALSFLWVIFICFSLSPWRLSSNLWLSFDYSHLRTGPQKATGKVFQLPQHTVH